MERGLGFIFLVFKYVDEGCSGSGYLLSWVVSEGVKSKGFGGEFYVGEEGWK